MTEGELKDIYAEYVQEHYVDGYTDGAYAQMASYVAAGYTDIPYLYIPEDFLFVHVIQLSDAEKAQDILTKIKEGEDFETYRTSEDNESGVGNAADAEKGTAIGENDSPFDAVVYDIAKDMNAGDVELVQAVVKNSEGDEATAYFIVKRVEGTTGVVPYEDVKDAIDSTLKSHEESEYVNEKVEAWREKADIVINEELVQAFDPAK